MTWESEFTQYLAARRAEIEAALIAALPAPPGCPAVVATAMRYSVTAGGKRLRPILCLASAEAVGGNRALALPAACALEFIHTYSLIHDDLPAMDNDTLRRGRPTLHVVAGEGIAILAGDGLLTEAFALMAREPATADPTVTARKLRVIGVVAAAAGSTGMVGGQALDLAASRSEEADPSTPPADGEGVRVMHAKKTGALIRAAAMAGAIMGGADDRVVQGIDAAAADLGLAFQIIDDVLDVEGVSAKLGKTPGKDAAAGKATYPALYGIEAARRMATACVDRADSILSGIGLGTTRLTEIGRWIVNRSH
jgi:geranylgeranyl diphosphate synthase type II